MLYPIKGEPGTPSLTVYTPGGALAIWEWWCRISVFFHVGEEVIVFLAHDTDGRWIVVGGEQGNFNIREGQVVNRAAGLQEPLGAFLERLAATLQAQGVEPVRPSPAAWAWSAFLSPVSRNRLEPTAPSDVRRKTSYTAGSTGPVGNPMGEPYLVNNNSTHSGAVAGSAADFFVRRETGRPNMERVDTANFNFTYGGSTSVAATQYDGINAVFWKDTGFPGRWAERHGGIRLQRYRLSKQTSNSTIVGRGAPQIHRIGMRWMCRACFLHEMGHWLSLDHDDDPICSTTAAEPAGHVLILCLGHSKSQSALQRSRRYRADLSDEQHGDAHADRDRLPLTATPSPTATPNAHTPADRHSHAHPDTDCNRCDRVRRCRLPRPRPRPPHHRLQPMYRRVRRCRPPRSHRRRPPRPRPPHHRL